MQFKIQKMFKYKLFKNFYFKKKITNLDTKINNCDYINKMFNFCINFIFLLLLLTYIVAS